MIKKLTRREEAKSSLIKILKKNQEKPLSETEDALDAAEILIKNFGDDKEVLESVLVWSDVLMNNDFMSTYSKIRVIELQLKANH